MSSKDTQVFRIRDQILNLKHFFPVIGMRYRMIRGNNLKRSFLFISTDCILLKTYN